MAYAKLLKINSENPEIRKIGQVVNVIADGGVVVYPTDTVYGIGCDLFNRKAIERVKQIKGIKSKSVDFSFICHDLSQLSYYTKGVRTPVFKAMKRTLPGPFTFIVAASSKVPKILGVKKKTVGIRIPDHNTPKLIVQQLQRPIITSSIHDDHDIAGYPTDPGEIFEKFNRLVDIVVDGGFGANMHSTVLNCTDGDITLVREGAGAFDILL